MADLTTIHTVADFRRLAKKRLPRFAFDFIEGGAGDELALSRNETAFRQLQITPRIGLNPEIVQLDVTLFGHPYTAPFGIAPLGLCGLVHPRADIQLASAAVNAGLPYIASSTASIAVEEIASATGVSPWFQLYAPKCNQSLTRLIGRVERAECPVLVITVDTAAPGKRIRDLRNGLTLPFRPRITQVMDAAMHPKWTLQRIGSKPISFPNLPSPADMQSELPFRELMSWQTGGSLDWDVLKNIRQIWPRKLVLKGVLSVHDARFALSLGIDGVIVSNHGGRQLESAPAPISLIAEFVNSDKNGHLMLDSGARSGEDILKSLALGADCTFLGRPFLYAAAAAGDEGVKHLIDLLKQELCNALKLSGVASIGLCQEKLRAGIKVCTI